MTDVTIQPTSSGLKGLARVRHTPHKRSKFEKWFLPVLLTVTFGLYLYGALQNGMANSYYAAAVQAASQSWQAWFFGGLDSGGFISIDKPPLATMIMGLSARLLGFSSFSMMLPNVLAGVGTVWLVYATVRRQFGFASAAVASLVMATTPVAVLMFGFNNPDALLVFFLTASVYAGMRALENRHSLRWLGVAGLMTGLAFNTKMLQGLMVLPALVVVYLWMAAPRFSKRVIHVAFLSMVTAVASLWWAVAVWLTPVTARPYVGSTSDNNIWSLIFGYNGFGRLFGTGSGMGASGGRGGGATGGGRALPSGTAATMGGGMPSGAGGVGRAGGGPGGTGFGGQTGLFRMFNSDFGPNIGWWLGAAVILAVFMLWVLRNHPRAHRGRAQVLVWVLWLFIHAAVFSVTSGVIHPYYVVAMAPAVAALVGIGVPFMVTAYRRRNTYAWVAPVVVLSTTCTALVILGYTAAFGWVSWVVGVLGLGVSIALSVGLLPPRVTKWPPRWYAHLQRGVLLASVLAVSLAPFSYAVVTASVAHTGSIPTAGSTGSAMQQTNNESSQADTALVAYLLEHQGAAVWLAAVSSANESAPLQLSSGQPVMAIGGFNGSDAALSLSQLKALVASGKVKYFVVSSDTRGTGPGGASSENSEIISWVKQYGTVVDYGGSGGTVYALPL